MQRTIHRGRILHFPKSSQNPAADYRYLPDGVLVIEDDRISCLDDATPFFAEPGNHQQLQNGEVTLHKGLLLPGLIDNHVHFPQIEMIASYGKHLLDWLNSYAFPAEQQCASGAYANAQAEFFLDQLLAHGTTSAGVFATVHPQSVDALFTAAQVRQARMICGKMMMDRNSPAALMETPEQSYRQSKALIERWHKNGRALYAISPRFAPSCSPALLKCAGKLAKEHPDSFIQTHLSESQSEITWVRRLYPDHADYLSIYQAHHLVRERALFGHGVHLLPRELQALHASGAAICFCPSSNLFLGSGLFNYQQIKQAQIPVTVASDIGAGTSLNLFANLADAYKICQLQDQSLDPFELLYLCTQGAAAAMGLEHLIGNLNPGSEADFIELDLNASAMLQQRLQRCTTLSEELFAIITLSDERIIQCTYLNGNLAYQKPD